VWLKSRRWVRDMTRTLLAILAALLLAPATASAEGTFVDWTSFLPATATQYEPSSADECTSGRIACVDKVIRQMTRDFDRLAAACDHNAIFSLAYLRTTEEYRRAATEPGFFEDPAFVNHQDAVFAAYYFRPLNAYRAGDLEQVPGAWRVAFDAARDKRVSAAGNAFLGFNAHIQRDLPYVLEEIGLVKPAGSTRKTDHDKVNQFLNRVSFTAELAARFDPTFDDMFADGTTIDDTLIFQMFPAWREEAWRNAERLARADTPARRAAVQESIEAAANATALAMRAMFAYPPLQGGAAQRDAHCRANG
jgi:hypothetical protein